MKHLKLFSFSIMLAMCFAGLLGKSVVRAQSRTPVFCGDIITDTFTKQQALLYVINLQAGSKLEVAIKPFGTTLQINATIVDTTGQLPLANSGNALYPYIDLKTDVLSADGVYRIDIANSSGYYDDGRAFNDFGGLGKFTFYITCTMPDGTVIAAGQKAPTPTVPSGTQSVSPATATPFTGTGFPGLQPVDFSNAVTVPLQPNSNDGTLPATRDTILGYTMTGKAGNTVDLSFTRVKGNLNLGLVVLSSQNQVIFQASLVNTKSLTAEFMLPTDDTYTIGVFRISLLPPAKPEATSFQIQAKIS